jgi:hypothetical protein
MARRFTRGEMATVERTVERTVEQTEIERIDNDASTQTLGPRLLRDRARVEERQRSISAPHVAPLNGWVRSLRNRLGPSAVVPWFDPADGGVDADILYLLEAPGPKATVERGGSGFISCDNNDSTAENAWRTRVEAGVERRAVVHWNVIPYYLGSATKIRPWGAADVAAVGPLLSELLGLLPALRAVILGGRAAQRTWDDHAPSDHSLVVRRAPHPSPTNLNTRPHARAAVVEAWRSAALL